ncbi:phosphomannomutase [Corynebacterium phocae]|uniref:Phosphomannomutase n=1 Tax=Corynebacterium phocae TaxID=161895 RepID=A0A1L7D166_9CORY|nr:phospho-sugar mutase [Corynebacterium phocae]APT91875.1 phosphomannomutase [Corynebacterium phocae]KAA8727420.1 phospho-sugar mutase [Corynebacterium phocae]
MSDNAQNTTLKDFARTWAEHDPDPQTKQQVLDWLEEGNQEELAKAFNGPLEFGTAGLRAEVGPGQSRMNRATVIRTTFGLIEWLKTQTTNPVVVIGCDARHGSAQFQEDAAGVISAAGGKALVLPKENPTPLTAFTVKSHNADAGIMVTASHNPPADNGYKVYLGGRVATGDAEGVQLISPADKEIAAMIDAAPYADEITRDSQNIEHVDTRADYIDRAVKLVGPKTDITVALTAMHGVGAAIGEEVLNRAGFNVSLVPEQAQPDPDFPTVAFPNPEEPGALDLGKAHADKIGADILIAYDPDADRCAAAVPAVQVTEGATTKQWRQLSGDETGALLGDYLARRGVKGTFANSLVSSRLLGRVAAHHGLEHEETLTGFKWIARTKDLAFGYEEAIGFCPDPEAVRDKDGISTSVVLASLAAECKAEGTSLLERLDSIYAQVGHLHTAPLTFRVDDLSIIAKGMEKVTNQPPTQLAGSPIAKVEKFAQGSKFFTENDDRVIVRPSGTEPKLKCYLESPDPARLDAIAADLREYFGI